MTVCNQWLKINKNRNGDIQLHVKQKEIIYMFGNVWNILAFLYVSILAGIKFEEAYGLWQINDA